MCCNKDSLKTIKYSPSAQIGDEKCSAGPPYFLYFSRNIGKENKGYFV